MPVTATINRKRFVLHPFSEGQMRRLGEAVLAAEVARIKSGRNVRGAQARALTTRYAKRKGARGEEEIRNLVYSGRTLDRIKVKSATTDKVVIGPGDNLTKLILLSQNARGDRMWGLSADGRRAGSAVAQSALRDTSLVRLEEI